MFGGPHQRDEGKRIEQSGWSTKNRTTTSAKCSPHKLLPRSCTGVYTRIKNLTESLLTRPTSLDMSPRFPPVPIHLPISHLPHTPPTLPHSPHSLSHTPCPTLPVPTLPVPTLPVPTLPVPTLPRRSEPPHARAAYGAPGIVGV